MDGAGRRLGRLATAFGDESVEDSVVVTGVVMALTVDTTAMGLKAASITGTIGFVAAGSVGSLLADGTSTMLLLDIGTVVVPLKTSSFFLDSFSFNFGATTAST